jgi:hypothetical protein
VALVAYAMKNDWLISANKRRKNEFYWLNPANYREGLLTGMPSCDKRSDLFSAMRQAHGKELLTTCSANRILQNPFPISCDYACL